MPTKPKKEEETYPAYEPYHSSIPPGFPVAPIEKPVPVKKKHKRRLRFGLILGVPILIAGINILLYFIITGIQYDEARKAAIAAEAPPLPYIYDPQAHTVIVWILAGITSIAIAAILVCTSYEDWTRRVDE